MPLTAEQQELYDKLRNAIIAGEDITDLLKQVKKEDFLTIFTENKSESKETLLGTFETVSLDNFKAVLNHAKELGLLKEVVREEILSSKNQDEVKYISLIECITDLSRQYPSKVLNTVVEVFKEEFFASLSKDELEKIKVAIEKELENETGGSEQQSLKKLIVSIGELIESRVEAESDTGKINQKVEIKGNEKVENKLFSPTSKAVVAGAICGVIAGLAVGGGCFAAGVALPMLALIGIAVAAALVTGIVAGGITYKMSMPSSEVPYERLDSVDTKQGVSSGRGATA